MELTDYMTYNFLLNQYKINLTLPSIVNKYTSKRLEYPYDNHLRTD